MTGEVESCVCRFCEVFGREKRVGGKRKRTKRVKRYAKAFRSDHIQEHLRGQHSAKWPERKKITSRSRESCFEKREAALGAEEEIEASGEWLASWFDKKLVEAVIGEVLADSDDQSEKAAALSVFERQDAQADDCDGCD